MKKMKIEVEISKSLYRRMLTQQARMKNVTTGCRTIDGYVETAIRCLVEGDEEEHSEWSEVDWAVRNSPGGERTLGRAYDGSAIWGLAVPALDEKGEFALDARGSQYYRPATAREHAAALQGVYPQPVAEV